MGRGASAAQEPTDPPGAGAPSAGGRGAAPAVGRGGFSETGRQEGRRGDRFSLR